MKFTDAETILETIHAKYKEKPELLEAAIYALQLAVLDLRWCSQDDGTAVLQSPDELDRLKLERGK